MKEFNLFKAQKRGSAMVNAAIAVVVLLILISALAPTALVGLFNSTAFTCPNGILNATGCFEGGTLVGLTGVPGWIPLALGSLGAVAFIYIIWRAASS